LANGIAQVSDEGPVEHRSTVVNIPSTSSSPAILILILMLMFTTLSLVLGVIESRTAEHRRPKLATDDTIAGFG